MVNWSRGPNTCKSWVRSRLVQLQTCPIQNEAVGVSLVQLQMKHHHLGNWNPTLTSQFVICVSLSRFTFYYENISVKFLIGSERGRKGVHECMRVYVSVWTKSHHRTFVKDLKSPNTLSIFFLWSEFCDITSWFVFAGAVDQCLSSTTMMHCFMSVGVVYVTLWCLYWRLDPNMWRYLENTAG